MDRNNKYESNGNPAHISINSSRFLELPNLVEPESVDRTPPSPSLNINRYAYNVTLFNEYFNPIPTASEEKYKKFKPDLSRKAWIRRFKSLFPITVWLPEYNIKQNLFADILVGITIAIFQVPQSNY
jgi:hypothetical protein